MASQGRTSEKDIKMLWGRAGGKCSMPDCRLELSSKEGPGFILGEMAHIKAEKEGGPRWDPRLTSAERNSYSNLILLCPTHHTEIDSNPKKWTVERLHELKNDHEKWFREASCEQFTEFGGEVDVRASGGDTVTGAKVTKPTRFKAGTRITVDTKDVKHTTGLQIGGDNDES